jgi:hypothetical protein
VRDFAARAKQAKLSFQPFNFIEGFLTRCAQMHWVSPVQHEFKSRRHRMPGEGDNGHRRFLNFEFGFLIEDAIQKSKFKH